MRAMALAKNPNAKFAVISQNDDFGRDYLLGLKDVFGEKYDQLVTAATCEVPDLTIDSQIVKLKASGADVLLIAATPKFAAQSIRKIFEIGWKPLTFLSNVAAWVATVMEPAGREPGSASCPPPMSRISTIPPGRTMPASRDGGNSWSNTFPRPTCTTTIMSIPTTARWRWKPE